MKTLLNYIDGKWSTPSQGQYLDGYNPATGEAFLKISRSTSEDVNLAVNAAKKAFLDWSSLPTETRANYLDQIANAIEKRIDEFAKAESEDQGKPIHLAKSLDIPRAVKNFRFFAGAVRHWEQESTMVDPTTLNYVVRKPKGVAGLISPWNLPLYLLSWKIAPAIAVGNTVVAKPSEVTSLTAHLLTEVLQGVGLPPGVINIIYGRGDEAGQSLVSHPDVPIISFTGGTATGQKISESVASQMKKVSLELGGKNPTIVFADADPSEMWSTLVRSSFLNQGEICLCGSRIYVEEKYFESFTRKLVEEVEKLSVGNPADSNTFMGPLVSREHHEKVLRYIEIARQEGGKILTGGVTASVGDTFKNGYWLKPTVISNLSETSKCVQEEIFGPVITVAPFKDFEDVVQKANGVKYGLSATVWTSNLKNAHALGSRLQAGTVWVNTWLNRDLRMPFGGVKASGVGREGGRYSLEFFTESTTVCVRFP